MLRKKWFALLAGLTMLLTACTTALESVKLPGLQVLGDSAGVTNSADAAPDALGRLADQAEANEPLLDVVQISRDKNGAILVYVVLRQPSPEGLSEQELSDAQVESVRTTAEAVWEAGLKHAPDAASIAIVFMDIRPVNTLDRGPAPTAWQVLGIITPVESAARYLQGPHDLDTFMEFATSDEVIVATLDQAYLGRPNHPLRSLEA